MTEQGQRMRSIVRAVVTLAAAAVLYELLARSGYFAPALLPTIPAIVRTLIAMLANGTMIEHAAFTMYRVMFGFGLAIAIGIPLGILMARFPRVETFFLPLISALMPIPSFALVPLFMLWFGIGDLSKILIIALACFYPAFINAYYGARATRSILVWSALNMGAGRGRIFRRIVVPSALPQIFAGLRVALALSFIVMFATEMINARSGLGHLIRVAENSLRFDLMYVSLAAIAILGYGGDRLVRLAHSRLLSWQA